MHVLAADVAAYLGAQFGVPLQELVADFVRDSDGVLWLLQVSYPSAVLTNSSILLRSADVNMCLGFCVSPCVSVCFCVQVKAYKLSGGPRLKRIPKPPSSQMQKREQRPAVYHRE